MTKKPRQQAKQAIATKTQSVSGGPPPRKSNPAVKVVSRPRGDARREVFVKVATEEFLAAGFGNTSLSAIVGKAGGSMATLYAQFGSKEALFEAIMEHHSERILSPLARQPGESEQSIEQVLEEFGLSLMRALLQPETLATYRVVVAEGAKFESIRNAFLDRGIGRGEQTLAALLRDRAIEDRLRIEDPLLAAQRLIALLQANLWTRAACGTPMNIGPARLKVHVKGAVAFFLAGCRNMPL